MATPPPFPSLRRARMAALTLTELLVSLALLALLTLLITAGMGKVRKAGAAAGDLGNMRQMLVAMEAFCQDHPNEGRIFFAYDRYTGGNSGAPNRYGYGSMPWMRLLRPYFGEERMTTHGIPAFISPGDPSRGMEIPFYKQEAAAWGRRSYSFNIQTLDPAPSSGLPKTNSRRRIDIRHPSRFVYFANHRATLLDTNWIDPANAVFTNAIPDDWYAGKAAHFAFVDGHVEMIPVQEVLPGGARHSIFYP